MEVLKKLKKELPHDVKALLTNTLDQTKKYQYFRKKSVTVKTSQYVNIDGENISNLIGYRGATINALQVLATAIANKYSTSKTIVIVDVCNYKEKREKTLEELAEKISQRVIKTGKSITLDPMSAYERKIIHTKLQENEKVKTFSKGEEPHRRVVIALK